MTGRIMLLLVAVILFVYIPQPVSAQSNIRGTNDAFQYNICNGLSNQLLYHAASIAIASEQAKKEVEIPNYFIVNGVQHTVEDILPSASNSIALDAVFDTQHLLAFLREKLGIHAKLVNFDFAKPQISCAGMTAVGHANPVVLGQILDAFRPSSEVSAIYEQILDHLKKENRGTLQQGVCVHHRDGQDWHNHCASWSAIPDGTYRGNCLGVPGKTFLESLESRGLWTNPSEQNEKWVYYCGDHEIPTALLQANYKVFSMSGILTDAEKQVLKKLVPGGNPAELRDLLALVDFHVCKSLDTFIGNSVSTFSALQIGMRKSENAYWYNSQSIPLGNIWGVYQIPIVYTYTELSQESGKYLLRASIASARYHMPHNSIHILYHGKEDTNFLSWLQQQGVVIHPHEPEWKDQIETMRQNGDPSKSHLFLHAGNFLGTWQRIDIPFYINSEYCLYLDSDTIVMRPFTFADFGLDVTNGIAMSAEIRPNNQPANAGVLLENIPFMRDTHHDFLDFIMRHVQSTKFSGPSPGDQGALLEFYEGKTRFLPRVFNFKPYWKKDDVGYEHPVVLHFHGAKPHNYLQKIFGYECVVAIRFLCGSWRNQPYLCHAMQAFARALPRADRKTYCKASFPGNGDAVLCSTVLDILSARREECLDLGEVVRSALDMVPDTLELNKAAIRKMSRRNYNHGMKELMFIVLVGISAVLLRTMRQKQRMRKVRTL